MRTYPNLLQVIGIIGFLTYIIGFALVQCGKVCGNGVAYPASKVFAATCVLISLVGAFNLASMLIQLSYILIGIYGVGARYKAPDAYDTCTAQIPIPQNTASGLPRVAPAINAGASTGDPSSEIAGNGRKPLLTSS